ncbi:MAG: hypothetical protein WCI64_05935 [Chlorobium sp.]
MKEQLKRIGGMEFWDTNFSFIDKNTQEETFVSLPEERSSHLIENSPLQPGVCYTATSDGENLTLVRIETAVVTGSGKLNISGTNSAAPKEDIKTAINTSRPTRKPFSTSSTPSRTMISPFR